MRDHPTGSTDPQRIGAAVTALFVPGNRPDRFLKAARSGADVVIIDLEDAVAPEAKESALGSVLDGLDSGTVRALIRVNAMDSPWFDHELSALLALTAPAEALLGIMVPKSENAEALEHLASRLIALPGRPALVPLIETAAGIVAVQQIAAIDGVTRLAFGALDFAADIESSLDNEALLHARSHLVVQSRAARIAAPLDSPSTDLQDLDAVLGDARYARGLGFGGKLCIHPAQVPAVEEAFAPTEEELRWARSIIRAGDGAVRIDGQMVDRPVVERAERLLARAGASRRQPGSSSNSTTGLEMLGECPRR